MPPRHRRMLRAAGLAALLSATLLATGCVSPADDGDPEGEQSEGGDEPTDTEGGSGTLATTVGSSTDAGSSLEFAVTALNRLPSGVVMLEFQVTNHSEDPLRFSQAIAGQHEANTAHAVTLIDGANLRRHFPQEYTDGSCYCSDWAGEQNLAPGGTLDIWVAFPEPPRDTGELTVEIPQAPPMLDVPLAQSGEGPPPEGELAEPDIRDILALSDAEEGDTGRAESGEETAIMLSTDVLFEVNESELTPEAEEILVETAAEIDAASGESVQVDGHADNTGSDAINDPLSEERANAVQEQLAELVTREGVSYETAGHGSREPIADNDTEAGREKNRRVTVTFSR